MKWTASSLSRCARRKTEPFIKRMPALLLAIAVSICAGTSAFAQSFTVDGVDSSTTDPSDIVCVGATVNITVTPSCSGESDPTATVADANGGTTDVTLTDDGNGNWNGSYSASSAGTFTVSATDDCGDSFDDVTLTVVQLNSVSVDGAVDVDASPTPSILDVNYATLMTTSSSDFVTLTSDLTPNNATAATLLTWTGGTASSDNLSDTVPKNVAAKTEVVASCCSAFFTKDIWVISAVIKSLQFTSDHGVMTTNNSDWTDCSATFQKPEWVADASHPSFPISQTKNTTVTVNLTFNIQPAGVPFNLTGSSGSSFLNFGRSDTSSGSDQSEPLTGGSLPNQIGSPSDNISWSIDAFNGVFNCTSASSGPHKIYVTYDTPTGSATTEHRISKVCTIASGKTTINDIENAIGTEDMGLTWWNADLSLQGSANYNNAWEIMGFNNLVDTIGISGAHYTVGQWITGADCISCAKLMVFKLGMLGIAGATTVGVCPCHNNWDALISGYSEIDSTYGRLIYYDNSKPNVFEGCCVFNGHYWTGGFGSYCLDAWLVLNRVTNPNTSGTGNHQAYNGTTWTWTTAVPYPTTTPPSY